MRLTITTKLVQRRTPESSAFTATARFFDDSSDAWAAYTPTTIDYRIDRIRRGDPSCYSQVKDWTSVTPATSASIAVTADDNGIQNDSARDEWRQLTVTANRGLSTQVSQTYRYSVVNLAGQVAA